MVTGPREIDVRHGVQPCARAGRTGQAGGLGRAVGGGRSDQQVPRMSARVRAQVQQCVLAERRHAVRVGCRRHQRAKVGEEYLQRDDWLVLFTDGIVEARDSEGRQFGTDRLIHFLQREAAGELPPPETVRRLMRAVMVHQNNVLQDDATVLLARWDGADLSV
jgi:serine/threonine protein phosphatase PrpC